MLTLANLTDYWSASLLTANSIIFLNILGALLLGLLVGYERSYHGRAAGMRTYGLVCMASAALTVFAGYPQLWYGGHHILVASPDPTRVIQGVVTGIGFLGAGVIMKEGLNISGLTTAASLWASSAIGVMVGIGFYAAAILLALLSMTCMMWISKLEAWLPSRHAIGVKLCFDAGFSPQESALREAALRRGYEIAGGSLYIRCVEHRMEWHFVAVALDKKHHASLTALAQELSTFSGVASFELGHARN